VSSSNALKSHSGFTMVEVIATMVILGILSVITMSFISDSAGIMNFVADEADIQNELWVAMERITRDAETGSIVINSATSITIANAKRSSANCPNCQDNATTITYSLTGTTLNRTGTGTFPIADSITAPAGTIFSWAVPLKVLKINMTKTEGDTSLTFMTTVTPNIDITEDIQ